MALIFLVQHLAAMVSLLDLGVRLAEVLDLGPLAMLGAVHIRVALAGLVAVASILLQQGTLVVLAVVLLAPVVVAVRLVLLRHQDQEMALRVVRVLSAKVVAEAARAGVYQEQVAMAVLAGMALGGAVVEPLEMAVFQALAALVVMVMLLCILGEV